MARWSSAAIAAIRASSVVAPTKLDPAADLSAMLRQVVDSVFRLMQEYEPVWQTRFGSKPAELFGFRFDVGLDPIDVSVERMVNAFYRGCHELGEIWALALQPKTYTQVLGLGKAGTGNAPPFHLDDELWARVILDFACAYRRHPLSSGQLLQSLTPLYLARVASFVEETRNLSSAQVEEKIEQLCMTFETLKPYLLAHWAEESVPNAEVENVTDGAERGEEANLEV